MRLGFLTIGRRERTIFEGILAHLDVAAQGVESFEAGVTAFARGDTKEAEKQIGMVFEAETKADSAHRKLSLQVAEGAFFGGVREDILNLMERIDDIADSAKDAARFLAEDTQLGSDGEEMLASESMKLFLSDLKATVNSLRRLVGSLQVGRKAAMAMVHTVEESEERADTHKDAFLKELFSRAASMAPLTVVQLRDFTFIADDIADNAEDAGDVILVLLAKGYG